MKTELGEYSRQDLSASVDLPLSDTLLSKITAGAFTQDGQVCSLTVPACYGGKDDELFRADFLWTPSENFNLRVAYDYQRQESSDRKAVVFSNENDVHIAALNIAAQNPAFRSDAFLPITEYTPRTHEPGFPGGEVGAWETKGDGPENGITTDYDALTVTMNWDINDNISLESISAWWEKSGRNYRDIRGAEVIEGVEDDQYTLDEVWSQEFHLTGVALDDRLKARGPLVSGLRRLGYQLPLACTLGPIGGCARPGVPSRCHHCGSKLREGSRQLGCRVQELCRRAGNRPSPAPSSATSGPRTSSG